MGLCRLSKQIKQSQASTGKRRQKLVGQENKLAKLKVDFYFPHGEISSILWVANEIFGITKIESMQTFVLRAGVSEVQGEIMETDHSQTLHCVALVSPK